MSKAVYDDIAKEYKESKQLPFRRFIERPTLFNILGNVEGLRVLDLACGDGIYSREMARRGAKEVVAVDVSGEIVALGEAEEKRQPLGVRYMVADAAELPEIGAFDIVFASYLLNYSTSPEHLRRFCAGISRNLKKSGRLVGFNDNPHNMPQLYASYRPYGFTKSTTEPRKEGSAVTYTFYNEDGTVFSFDNFFLEPATYERVLGESGLQQLQWHELVLSPEGEQTHGSGFWQAFLDNPPVIGFSAIKLS